MSSNNNYLEQYRRAGLVFSGLSRDELVEIVELPAHPWFLATQFHPEFTSTPRAVTRYSPALCARARLPGRAAAAVGSA